MKAVLKVAPSVVCLTTTIELNRPRFPSPFRVVKSEVNGTIFCCEEDKSTGLYHSFILTSADVLRPHHFRGGRYIPACTMMCRHVHGKDLIQEVHVQVPTTRTFYEGEVVAFDDHYNIAVVLIKSDAKLPTAPLMCIDDWFLVGVPDDSTTPLDHQPCYSKMLPGDKVFVVGRRFDKSNDLNVCSGESSADYLGPTLDLENLFRIRCETITNGGLLLELPSVLIGLLHVYQSIYFSNGGNILVQTNIQVLEPSFHLHGLTYGVVVEEVKSGSLAHVAGIRSNDIIFECGGRSVRSFLEGKGWVTSMAEEGDELVITENLFESFDERGHDIALSRVPMK